MPTFGSETYRSTNAREVIRPGDTTPLWMSPEAIPGPDWMAELQGVAPPNIKAGPAEPDKKVNVTGKYFMPTSIVLLDGTEMPTTYKTPTTLEITVQPSKVTGPLPQKANLQVRNRVTMSNIRTVIFTSATELE